MAAIEQETVKCDPVTHIDAGRHRSRRSFSVLRARANPTFQELDLYDRPRNVFVAGFIGSPAMNFLEGTLEASPVLALAGGSRLPMAIAPPVAFGTPLLLGIRPEDIAVDETGVEVLVKVVEPIGSETHVALEIGAQELT